MRFPLSLTLSLSAYILRNRMAGKKMFPLVLMLEPLHACNLACAGCGRIREYSGSLDNFMSVEECLSASRECGAPIVSVCGGEPLIYPEIGRLVSSLIEMHRHIYLCTNGLLLRQKLSEFTPSTRLIFNVHLDGQEETHDSIVDRHGAFLAAFDGIVAAKEKGFLVSTNTTIYSETDMADVEALFERLSKIGVDSHMISPGYDYEAVKNGDIFLRRQDIINKFSNIDRLARRFRLSNTPIYIDFLQGKRNLPCTAWGNPTRNPSGWRSPCYMLADKHVASYEELLSQTDWDSYGPGQDERCKDCMVHCGFEPSVVLAPGRGIKDLLRLALWQIS